MGFIKEIAKQSFLFGIVQRSRAREWMPSDQKMLEFYSRFVSPGALCFDVGANTGNRTKILLKLQARVVAVEPQSRCVRILRARYGHNRQFTLVEKALGDTEGEAEMMISDADTISSLSAGWIEAVKQTRRFAGHDWSTKQIVPVTTLDKLISRYGAPDFIKVDVEGYEYEVMKGLSCPVKMISLEFTPEFIDSTFKCIDHLQKIGDISLNYSVGESMTFSLSEWVEPKAMVEILSGFRDDHVFFGDVYVRFAGA